VAVILGVAILDERFTAAGIFQWTVLALSAIGMTVATIELSRSSAKHDEKVGVVPG
jgi:hypothetical protein